MEQTESLKISVVTPNFNQGKYIEETIKSVLDQNYPNLEFIIMDGGSTDNSVEIIKKYESHISYWESKPDNGQADAINMGFELATGDILAWLNSDDYYLPDALVQVGRMFSKDDIKILFGNCLHYFESSGKEKISNVFEYAKTLNIELCDFIKQPSSFWTRETYNLVGNLNADLTYGFDWDWYIRAKRKAVLFQPVDKTWSVYRIHEGHKSGSGGNKRDEELAGIYKNYHSENIARSFLHRRSMQKNFRRVRQANKFLSHLSLNKLIDARKFLYNRHFSDISWEEFINISRM